MRDLFLVGIGVVVGVGLGFVFFHSAVDDSASDEVATGVEAAADNNVDPEHRAPIAPVDRHSARERVRPSHAPSPETATELEEARARLRELEARFAAEEQARVERQGEARPMPDDLSPRFRQEVVRTSVNAALEELGLEGEVTAVDCSEYPCLLVGELKNGPFGREESEKLGETTAMAAYGDDSKYGFGTTREDGERARHIFGVAVFPEAASAEEREALSKRLRYRFGEMQHEGE